MKTLILNGSTRKGGDTAALLGEMKASLRGDIVELSHFAGISPCADCRHCWKERGCRIPDALLEIYPFLETCDNLILASPVWFSELSGPLLNLASRLIQPYFAAARFRKEAPGIQKKNGVLLLAGAEKGTEKKARGTARTIMKQLNALPCVAEIVSMDTDRIPAKEDAAALRQAREAAALLNQLCS